MTAILDTKAGKLFAFTAFLLLLCAVFTVADYAGSTDTDEKTTFISSFSKGRAYAALRSGSQTRTARAKRQAAAQSAAAAASSGVVAETSATIHGLTTNEKGEPVEKAEITVRRAGTPQVLQTIQSAKDGKYSVAGLMPGTYDVLAGHAKFVKLIRPNFTINARDETVELNFVLPLGADVKGLVQDEEGKPLNGVRVAARRYESVQSQQDASFLLDDSTYKTQQSSREGTFTLEGLALGKTIYEIFKPGYAMERQTVELTPEKAAEPLKVVLKRTGILSGAVTDETGAPVSTATVHLVRYKPLKNAGEPLEKGKLTAVTDAAGNFKFSKLFNEGYYDLRVEHDEYAPGIYPLVSANSEQVACRLDKGGSLSGVTQFIDRSTTEASALVVATSVIKGTTFTAEAQSDGKGSFGFERLPYGTYSLAVSDNKLANEPKEGLACQKDKPVGGVVVEVYERSVLRGRVSNNEDDLAVANATVTVKASYGLPQARSKVFTAKTNGHGEFELDKLPAGIHTAQAEARGFLKGQSEKNVQSFILVPGERKSDLALFLNRGGSIEGFVVDAAGRSLPDCDLQVFAASQFHGAVDASKLKGKSDSAGFFRIFGIDVGERAQLFVSASKAGYTKTRSEMLELSPKSMTGAVQIRLAKGGQVTGIVTDKKKLPIPGAEITFVSHSFPGDPSPSTLKVHTQPNGTYVVNNCPPGGAAIAVARAGFVKQGRGVTVRDALQTDNVNFEMENGQIIAGTVADLEGNPIANAKVKATGLKGAAGVEEAITDKLGKYELKNLGLGEFLLEATFKLPTPEGEQNYRFVNASVPANTLAADIDCDLGNSASGRVEGEKSKGVDAFTVSLRSRGDTKPSQEFTFNLDRGLTTAKGFFRLSKVPRGLYDMTITADGYEPYNEQNIAIGPHRRTEFDDIRLKPAGGVIGSVYSSTTNRPVHNATVRLVHADEEAKGKSGGGIAGKTDMRGEFRVKSVPQGLYKAYIDHPSYIGTQLDLIHVTERKQRELGKLYLDAGGAVRGQVVNEYGDPVPGMSITVKGVVPAKATTTDAAGNYLLQGVNFGRWPVVARGQMNSRTVYSFQTVNVQQDESQKLDFNLETTANLEGLISGADLQLRSATISLHPYDETATAMDDIHYDARAVNNQFQIDQVPPGQYFLWAAGHGAVSKFSTWKNLFLERGENRTQLAAGSSKVEGSALDPAGQPVANLGVQLYPMIGNLRLTQNLYNKLVQATATDIQGRFNFEHLQPGAYQLLHQTPLDDGWFAQTPFSLGNGQRLNGWNLLVQE